jgi:hypothetical protein
LKGPVGRHTDEQRRNRVNYGSQIRNPREVSGTQISRESPRSRGLTQRRVSIIHNPACYALDVALTDLAENDLNFTSECPRPQLNCQNNSHSADLS